VTTAPMPVTSPAVAPPSPQVAPRDARSVLPPPVEIARIPQHGSTVAVGVLATSGGQLVRLANLIEARRDGRPVPDRSEYRRVLLHPSSLLAVADALGRCESGSEVAGFVAAPKGGGGTLTMRGRPVAGVLWWPSKYGKGAVVTVAELSCGYPVRARVPWSGAFCILAPAVALRLAALLRKLDALGTP